MTTIVHRIRLKPDIARDEFEGWVRTCDYASAIDLPSVQAFSVHRVVGSPGDPDYFEVIQVSGLEAFERDMRSATFRRLVEAFDRMATVVDVVEGERIEPGFHRRVED